MYFMSALIVSSILIKNVSSDSTKETTSSRDGLALAEATKDLTNLDSVGSNTRLNTLLGNRPEIHPSHVSGDVATRRTAAKPAHSLTRLAKTLMQGFDPYFSKGHFEPFEKRPKPVTLVAFRKNGLLPRTRANIPGSKSMEVAELQSPFNDISNFWVDD